MTRRNFASIASVVALVALVLAATALLITQPWGNDEPLVRAGADVSGGGACLDATVAPFAQKLIEAGDCVTSFSSLPNGDIVFGTKHGLLGTYREDELKSYPAPSATGPVTNVHAETEIATFVVEQGIGVLDIDDAAFVKLPSGSQYVASGYFVALPGPGRASYATGWYRKADGDGDEQSLTFDVGTGGDLCAVYLSMPGAVPARLWCTPPGTLHPEPVLTPVPRTGGGCSRDAAEPQDAASAITISISSEGYKPARGDCPGWRA